MDVAVLPVNGRDPEREARGIVGNMDAREAVELALAIGATLLVPIHWDGFAGNTVPPAQPPTPQRAACASRCRPVSCPGRVEARPFSPASASP